MAGVAVAAFAVTGLHSAAFAHTGTHIGGLTDGLAHPFSGLDHVLAMVAVGLWASQLDRPACWLLPVTFPGVMTLGAILALTGWPLPGLEIGIAGSVLVLGTAIAFLLRPSVVVSATLIVLAALFHGYSHGSEPPAAASPCAYGLGFVGATLVLHAVGLALGALANLPAGRLATRAAGAAIAATGLVFLVIP